MRTRSRLLRAASGKFGLLLVALVALVLSSPVIVEGWAWQLVLAVFAAGVLVSGLYAVRPRRQSLAIGLALASINLVVGRLAEWFGSRWLVTLQAILWLA